MDAKPIDFALPTGIHAVLSQCVRNQKLMAVHVVLATFITIGARKGARFLAIVGVVEQNLILISLAQE